MATPETGAETGTPQSIRLRLPAHTLALEDEPFDSRISQTRRMV
jgi:hypothetical protein